MIEEQYESGYIEESGDQYLLEGESGDVVIQTAAPVLPVKTTLDEKDLRDVVDKESLTIVNNIIESKSNNELTNYLDQFNLNMSKKNLLRILKMNELWDKVSDEALDRIENHSDELTNVEIINFIKVAQDAISNSKKAPDYAQTATPITLNQQNNTVNVNVSADSPRIDRRSKEKIMEAVSKLLNISLDETSEDNVIEEPIKENE